jgi:hypothetical protein
LIGWLVGWSVYSSCSHLEHRASVKRFVSLQFLDLRYLVGLLGQEISPSQGRYLTQTQNKHRLPRLEWESNPRSQRSSERRQFMPHATSTHRRTHSPKIRPRMIYRTFVVECTRPHIAISSRVARVSSCWDTSVL